MDKVEGISWFGTAYRLGWQSAQGLSTVRLLEKTGQMAVHAELRSADGGVRLTEQEIFQLCGQPGGQDRAWTAVCIWGALDAGTRAEPRIPLMPPLQPKAGPPAGPF